MRPELRKRVAEALGWQLEDTHKVSMEDLRELVRPKSKRLAYELSLAILSDTHITKKYARPQRRS